MALYDTALGKKPEIITASKIDVANSDKLERLRSYCQKKALPFQSISAVSGEGIPELRNAIVKHLEVEKN